MRKAQGRQVFELIREEREMWNASGQFGNQNIESVPDLNQIRVVTYVTGGGPWNRKRLEIII